VREPGNREQLNESDSVLRSSADRSLVEEWFLVLTADGFSTSMHHTGNEFAVCVPDVELEAASRALEQYERENAQSPSIPGGVSETIGEVDLFVAVAASLAMLSFFVWTGPRDPNLTWFAAGSADAAAILGGELWRTLTALCLHADLAHVVANALFGALFLAAAGGGYGPGVAIALTLAAGAGGNLANAIFQGPGHVSVGASTAVFGAVGLLAGRAVALRLRRGENGFRIWLPIAAGFAIIAMLGTGERSDIWAHLFGFMTGGLLGVPASLAWPRSASWPVQLAAMAASVAMILYAWRLALA
jgi:membrane associated rhomboid family serine protease